jgi:hypothetical protein
LPLVIRVRADDWWELYGAPTIQEEEPGERMEVTVHRISPRAMEALLVTMAGDITAGRIVISGKRVMNKATFKMDDPASYVADVAVNNPNLAQPLRGLVRRLARQTKPVG